MNALKPYQPVWAPLTVYNRICPACTERWQDGAPSPWVDIAVCPGCADWTRGRAELARERAALFYYQKKRPRGYREKVAELRQRVDDLKRRYPGSYARRRLSA